MISVNEAVEAILKRISPLPGEEVSLLEAPGRVLCEDVRAGRNVPPFANSAMDGYAVRWEDVAGASPSSPSILRVVERVPAGYAARRRVGQGTAIRIMTGAPIPRGADTVVRLEYAEPAGDEVRIIKEEKRGSHIRPAGEDIRKGETVLEKARVLAPPDVGLLASLGRRSLRVYRKPAVALISTGDELQELGDRPRRGKIVNSNSYMLAAAIQEIGALPRLLGIVRDKRKELARALRKALRYDVVVTTGGVSVGDYDLVKEALRDVGVEIDFWQVAQRPGHPLAFGFFGGKPVFGLPGNPVSSAISFLLYARPALLKMMGHKKIFLPVIEAALEHEIKKSPGVTEFIRCRLRYENDRCFASSTGAQGAGILRSLSLAQGLIVGREGATLLARGSQVKVILLGSRDRLREDLGF